jgi:hypothetical protein
MERVASPIRGPIRLLATQLRWTQTSDNSGIGAGASDAFHISAIRAHQRGTPADDGHSGSSGSGGFVSGSPGAGTGFVGDASPESCGDSMTPAGGGRWQSACRSIARIDTGVRAAAGVSEASAARVIQARGSRFVKLQVLLLLCAGRKRAAWTSWPGLIMRLSKPYCRDV